MKQFFLTIVSIEVFCYLMLTSCTISFQNISTHGTATDLVDENQAATADVKADVQVPVKAI